MDKLPMNHHYGIADVARVFTRNKWLVVVPTAIGLAAASVIDDGRFSLAGPVCGFLIGLAVVVVHQYRDSSFSREQDVSNILMLPVLGRVSNIASTRERGQRRLRRAAQNFIGCLVVLLSVAIFLWSRLS